MLLDIPAKQTLEWKHDQCARVPGLGIFLVRHLLYMFWISIYCIRSYPLKYMYTITSHTVNDLQSSQIENRTTGLKSPTQQRATSRGLSSESSIWWDPFPSVITPYPDKRWRRLTHSQVQVAAKNRGKFTREAKKNDKLYKRKSSS